MTEKPENNTKDELKKFLIIYFSSNIDNFILQKHIQDINEGFNFILSLEKKFKINCFSTNDKSYFNKYFIVYSLYNLIILNIVLLTCINCGIAIYYYFHRSNFIQNFLNFEILCLCILISLITQVQKFITKNITSKIIKQKKIPIKFDDLYQAVLNNKWEDPKHEKIKI